MNCEQVQVELSSESLSVDGRQHLESCAACQAEAQALQTFLRQVRLPDVSAAEAGQLARVQQQVMRSVSRRQTQPSWLKVGLGYAVAAGVGALITAAVFSHRESTRELARAAVAERTMVATDDSALHYSNDGVFAEVSWPSDSTQSADLSDTED